MASRMAQGTTVALTVNESAAERGRKHLVGAAHGQPETSRSPTFDDFTQRSPDGYGERRDGE